MTDTSGGWWKNLPKDWFTSKTIIAAAVASAWPLVQAVAGVAHITLPAQDSIVSVLASAGTVAAAAFAIYGRIVAKAPIAKPSTPKPPGA